MSLDLLIETPGGFDYAGAECAGCMKEAGLSSMRVEPLGGPESMVVGIRSTAAACRVCCRSSVFKNFVAVPFEALRRAGPQSRLGLGEIRTQVAADGSPGFSSVFAGEGFSSPVAVMGGFHRLVASLFSISLWLAESG